MRIGLAGLFSGCAGVFPSINEPPVLDTLNGVAVDHQLQRDGQDTIRGTVEIAGVGPGERLELTVEAEDPEGDPFGVWFPGAVGRVEFDPAERSGAIVLPEGFEVTELELELRDEGDDAMGAAYRVFLGL